MRDRAVVEKEILEVKNLIKKTDNSDLLKHEIYKSKLERLENELDEIIMGPKTISVVNGLPKGKYKVGGRSRLSDGRYKII